MYELSSLSVPVMSTGSESHRQEEVEEENEDEDEDLNSFKYQRFDCISSIDGVPISSVFQSNPNCTDLEDPESMYGYGNVRYNR